MVQYAPIYSGVSIPVNNSEVLATASKDIDAFKMVDELATNPTYIVAYDLQGPSGIVARHRDGIPRVIIKYNLPHRELSATLLHELLHIKFPGTDEFDWDYRNEGHKIYDALINEIAVKQVEMHPEISHYIIPKALRIESFSERLKTRWMPPDLIPGTEEYRKDVKLLLVHHL